MTKKYKKVGTSPIMTKRWFEYLTSIDVVPYEETEDDQEKEPQASESKRNSGVE